LLQRVIRGINKIRWAFVLALFVTVSVGSTVLAATISVSYNSTKTLPTGTIVAIDSQNNGAVVPANDGSSKDIVGVVSNQSAASVASSSTGQQVEVSSRGISYVLVSNINGAVAKGTPITSSPLEGIGMLAIQEGKIVGTAQADLNDQSLEAQYKTVKTKKGEDRRVLIGLVPVSLDVSYYQESNKSSVPKFLRDITASISGRQVSPIRIWGSVVVALVALIIASVLLYGAIRSSIGAIGRNPLATKAIQGSFLGVVGLAVTVLVISTGLVYLILKG
jgi:hypothetical protein